MKVDQYLSVKAAAKLLGVPEATFRGWVYRGLIPRTKFPGLRGRVLIRESDLAEVLARLREPGVQEIVEKVMEPPQQGLGA